MIITAGASRYCNNINLSDLAGRAFQAGPWPDFRQPCFQDHLYARRGQARPAQGRPVCFYSDQERYIRAYDMVAGAGSAACSKEKNRSKFSHEIALASMLSTHGT